ncbi:hypothetical protein [Enterococcus faecalis]|uniref:hypothetical protein n=1 Tax=Enterococcus faecalis TaxID=1351 RepID=UPI00242EB7F5|nr:hypothetical protein [Enterococcus faecalis]MEB5927388.1 hypothetical protein [Enterococcus faecalis]
MNLKLKKNQIVGLSIVATLALAGGAGFFVHNKQVQAQQIALEQKEKAEYDELKLDVNRAIQKAYDTRHEEDITSAENMIQKLKDKDKEYQKGVLDKLKGFLAQVKKTNDLLTKAEKTKADVDIQNAQKSINEEKDEYLSKDKKAHQTRLDKLKKEIADEKAKKEKEAKEKQAQEEQAKQEAVAQAQQAESQQADVQAQETAQAETPQAQASVPEVAQAPTQVAEAPQAQYQAPATQQAVEQAPVQTQPQPQAPTQTPSRPYPDSYYRPDGSLTQDAMNKLEQEASNADWSEFFK